MSPTSRTLYERCRSRSLPEQEQAYRELGRILHAAAWRRVAGRAELEHLAAECMQESLLIVWHRLEADRGPRDPDRFVGWCVVIVLNKLREALRRLEPRAALGRSKRIGLSRLHSLEAARDADGRSLAERLPSDEPEPEARRAYHEIQALIGEIASMERISEQSRTVLLRGYIEGLDDGELAAELETTRGNVHVIRHRDLAKLRQDADYLRRLRRFYEEA